MMPTKTEKAWAAGFFEGEGYVHFSGRTSMLNGGTFGFLQTEVSQVDPTPLQWLKERWGGSISRTNPKTARARPFYRWVLLSKQASMFLSDMQPYLVRAHVSARVTLAIAFQAQKTRSHENRTPEYKARQMAFIQEMAKLNRRGVERAALATRI